MRTRIAAGAAALVAGLAAGPPAHAAGGRYVVVGGTAYEQLQVREALRVSSFDWSVVPATITIRIARNADSDASPGEIQLDANLLDDGTFSWGVVQHEYAHQVEFFLFDAATQQLLDTALGASDWCNSGLHLAHGQYGCERFASTLAWAYWPSPENCMEPEGPDDESAAMPPAAFRALMARLLPTLSAAARARAAANPPSG